MVPRRSGMLAFEHGEQLRIVTDEIASVGCDAAHVGERDGPAVDLAIQPAGVGLQLFG
jgi:hypothetical protein